MPFDGLSVWLWIPNQQSGNNDRGFIGGWDAFSSNLCVSIQILTKAYTCFEFSSVDSIDWNFIFEYNTPKIYMKAPT